MGTMDWIGDWGLGIEDWVQYSILNHQIHNSNTYSPFNNF